MEAEQGRRSLQNSRLPVAGGRIVWRMAMLTIQAWPTGVVSAPLPQVATSWN